MKPYSLLFRLEKTLLINQIKSIISNPKRVISYLAYLVFMTWVVFVNIKNFSGQRSTVFANYASGGVFIFMLMIAYGMTKKSSIYFKMSEINLIFTAPIDQRKLLMFTLLKRIPVYLLTSIYTLIFIMSMVIGMYHPSILELVISCIGYSLVLLILEPLGFCLFAISTRLRKPELSAGVTKKIFIVLALGALVSVILSIRADGLNLQSIFAGLGNEWLNLLPIIGWGKALTLTAISGISASTFIYLGLMLGLYALLVILTYVLGTDYYEDVIETSELRTEQINKAKQGKYSFAVQLRKKAIKIKDDYRLAGAIHWKKRLLTSKSDISVYFSIETVLCLLISIGGFFFMKDAIERLPYIVSGIYFYIKFLFSMNTSLDKELGMHYFYTIPDTSVKKLINVLKIDVMRFFINIAVISIVLGVLGGHINGELVLLPFAVTSFYIMMLMASFTLKLFFSSEDFNRLLIMFKMLQMFVVLIPSLIALIVIGALTDSVFLALLGSTSVNILIVAIFLGLSDMILNRMELK